MRATEDEELCMIRRRRSGGGLSMNNLGVEGNVSAVDAHTALMASAAAPNARMAVMERLVKQFRHVAGSQGCLTFQQFKKVVDIRSDHFANSLFCAIDQDNSGSITCDEFVTFMFNLECQDLRGRLKMMFDLYDQDKTGGLGIDELTRILTESIHESNAFMDTELVSHLAQAIMDSFDLDGNGEISFEEFVMATSRHPELLQGLTIGGFKIREPRQSPFAWLHVNVLQAVRAVVNNRQRIITLALLVVLLISTFWWRASRYRDGYKSELMGWTLPVAKGCGQMLKVIFALILFPVSRSTLTRLRRTFLRHIFPFDDSIDFHKLLGTLGFIFAWIHSLCHVNDVKRWGDPKMEEVFHHAFPEAKRQPTHRELVTSLVAVTGALQLVIYTIVFLTASNWPRRTPWMQKTRIGKYLNNFNMIWYVHHLSGLMLLLVLFHPMPHIPDEKNEWGYSDIWAWIGIPIIIYLLERLARVYRTTKDVQVLDAELLPGRVLALKLSKPKNFNYRSGNYVFINVPAVAQFEWHPFSLTSAPSANHLTMHIKVAGDWTEELYTRFQEYEYIKVGLDQKENARKIIPLLSAKKNGQCQEERGKDLEADSKASFHTCRSNTGTEEMLSQTFSFDIPDKQQFFNQFQGFEETSLNGQRAQSLLPPDAWVTKSDTNRSGMRRALTMAPVNQDLSQKTAGFRFTDNMTRQPSWGRAKKMSLADVITDIQHSKRTLKRPSENLPPPREEPVREQPAAASHQIISPFQTATTGPSFESGPNLVEASQHSFTVDLDHIKDLLPVRSVEPPPLPLKLKLDGPFGAPVQSFKDYGVIMLVGAGIGVTPFASILSDLLHKMASKPGKASSVPGLRRLKKVYFHWSVKSQAEVMWFRRVLEALSQDDVHDRLEINVHVTGLRQSNDVRTMMFKLLQLAVHSETGHDVVTGLDCKILTHFGRPSWDKLISDLPKKHPGETIGVLYSGPNTLGRVLSKITQKHSSKNGRLRFTMESFGHW
ncbi:hypothetical protein BSKO_07435 [Bryopsis sp. KO-2023]|nr:hypothetical protein BSKO_07435 [Bryopsis sp. KO-2023]